MPKQTTPLQRCPKCGGSGQVKLPKHLESTLSYVRKHPNRTSEEIHTGAGFGGTRNATSNQLNLLSQMRLIDRKRDGKFYRYFAIKSR